MRKLLYISALFVLFGTIANAQTNLFSAGLCHTAAAPAFNPGARGCRTVLDTSTMHYWMWRYGTIWVRQEKAADPIIGCSAPLYTPTKWQSDRAINGCSPIPLEYKWNGVAWECLNCVVASVTDLSWTEVNDSLYRLNSSTGADVFVREGANTTASLSGDTLTLATTGAAYTAGTGIAISGGNVISNTGDLSTTNELNTAFGINTTNLRITDAGGNLDVPLLSISPIQSITAADFDLTAGVLALDYTNAQKATALVPGFLTAADWTTFNSKQSAGNYITALTGDVTATGPGSVAATIATGVVGPTQLASTAVTPGSYTAANITVDADGRVTAAANGSSGGITTLNTLTAATQTFATGTSGTDFAINSATSTHTFNLPTASATNRGALSSADWTTFNNKVSSLWTDGGATTYLTATGDFAAIGATSASRSLHVTSSDAVTNAITYPQRLTHTTSGTATTSFGAGMEIELENGSGTNVVSARQNVAFSDAVGTTEDATYSLDLIRAGSLTRAMTILSTGNVGIGTATPTSRMSFGSDGGYDGAVFYGGVGTDPTRLVNFANTFEIVTNGSVGWVGQGISVATGGNRTMEIIGSYATLDNSIFNIRTGSNASAFGVPTSGNKAFLNLSTSFPLNFAPTSGTATYTILNIGSVINQTGGASGITRGIYPNITLTATADWRGVDIPTDGTNTDGSARKAIYQSGSTAANILAGGTTFGATSPPNAAAAIDVTSTTKGVLFPRMTGTERDAISSPPNGLVLYNTTTDKLQVRAAGAWVDLH